MKKVAGIFQIGPEICRLWKTKLNVNRIPMTLLLFDTYLYLYVNAIPMGMYL